MKLCNRTTQMSEAIDGRLDQETLEELMAHIESCSNCRREYEGLCQTVSILHAVPPVDAPPDMAARVRQRLDQPRKTLSIWPILSRPATRVALAASLLIGISIYGFLRPTQTPLLETSFSEASIDQQLDLIADLDLDMEPDGLIPPSPILQPSDQIQPDPIAEPTAPSPAHPTLQAPPPPSPPPGRPAAPPPSSMAARGQMPINGRGPTAPAEQPVERFRQEPSLEFQADGLETAPGVYRRSNGIRAARPESARAGEREIAGVRDRDALHESRVGALATEALEERAFADDIAVGAETEAAPQMLVSGNSAFAADVYRELAAMHDGNLFLSPYSISSALAMAYAGARGNTAREIAAALRWPAAPLELHPAFRDLNRRIMSAVEDSGQKMNIANAVFLTGGDVDPAYKALLQNYYAARIFSGGLDEVNAWASRQTEGRIPKVLDQLSPNSICVILNAIYFKGIWQDAFEPDATRDAPFYVLPVREVTVPMMQRSGRYRLLTGDGFQAIAIPYRNETLSMIVLLPDSDTDIAAFESRLTARNLTTWQAELNRRPLRQVRLFLPRFKLETDYNLVPPSRRLGMRDAFVEGIADFTGMGWPKGEFWISQIKHRAFVEVNEEGTEAAAVTAIEMRTTALPEPEPEFRADRPFIFLIQDHNTGSILFMGRLREPA